MFLKRKEERRKDLEREIKRAVEEAPEVKKPNVLQIEKLQPQPPPLQEPQLFIKIDKYREITDAIERLDKRLSELERAAILLEQLKKLEKNVYTFIIEEVRRVRSELAGLSSIFSSTLPRFKEVEEREVELRDIEREIEELKRILERWEKL